MSIIDIKLKEEIYIPLVTKGSLLTASEVDINFREIYKALVLSATFENIDREIVSNKFTFTLTDEIKLSLVNITLVDDLEQIQNSGTGVGLILLRNATIADLTIKETAYIQLNATVNSEIVLEPNESELFLQIDGQTYLIGKSGVLDSVENGYINFQQIDEVASATNEGMIRYRKYTSAPYDYSAMEMCMLTDVATYSWVLIKENSWS